MSKLRPVIAEHEVVSSRGEPATLTHVEIVDEYGFAGYEPTGTDILQAYIIEYEHSPRTEEENAALGALAMRTITYHHQIFELATREIDLHGNEEDLREVSEALSLDTEPNSQLWRKLAEVQRTRQNRLE